MYRCYTCDAPAGACDCIEKVGQQFRQPPIQQQRRSTMAEALDRSLQVAKDGRINIASGEDAGFYIEMA